MKNEWRRKLMEMFKILNNVRLVLKSGLLDQV
jgi:hypothetical protein